MNPPAERLPDGSSVRFVSLEGGEGAGKTTLIAHLERQLCQRELPYLITRAPGGTPLGRQVREMLLHSAELTLGPRAELFLFLADRAQHVREVIGPALERGLLVLCDRFHDSTIAYQGAARGLDEEWVRALCHFASEGLHPTLTLYLDLPPERGLQRLARSHDKMETEELSFHCAVRQAYQRIAEREPQRFRLLDASLPADQVALLAWQQIESLCRL